MKALPTKTCRHCGHEWVIRVADPKKCPNCKNVLRPTKLPKQPA